MDKFYFYIIKPNKKIYLFLLLTFIVGLIAGSICSNLLTADQQSELSSLLSRYIAKIQQGQYQIDSDKVDLGNVYLGLLIACCGFFYLGSLFIFLTIGGKGFLLGFTINYALINLGGKGWLLVLSNLLPPNIIIIPTLIFQAVLAIRLILNKKGNHYKGRRPLQIKNYYKEYIIFNICALALLLFSGIVEVYISPLFFQLILNIFY